MRTILESDRRLVILRSLIDCGNEANESVLQSCLETYGHKVSRDETRTHMSWLAEQGLISLEDVCGCLIGNLTGRGQDVAEGRTTVPGVKKPRAGG
ncbi:ArsR family transcriptional regulator [Rahnella contaminans]|uniref:VpaChn25_0724 family phage protein n=1 Tax=Rahnella contaminans TaxID=2703882 RepID=UPI003C2CBE75